MNKFIDIGLLLLMGGVFIATFILIREEEHKMNISSVNVNIENGDSVRFITKDQIIDILKSDSLKRWTSAYTSCDTYEIERALSKLDYVYNVESYKQVGGVLNVDIKQKNIALRIITSGGKDLYIDDKMGFLPIVDSFVIDVPILTCDDEFLLLLQESVKINKKIYYNFHNLLNFVRLLESDPFWKSMIVQLNISKSGELHLIPRVGSHTVVLCDYADIENGWRYLQKLGGFYTKIVATQGWGRYKIINAKYNNIIVATK